MRTKFLVSFALLSLLLFTCANFLYSQSSFWNKSQKVTSGFIDKNPSFDTKRLNHMGVTGFSFLVFERWTMLMNSNICVIKFGYDSAYGGVQYITNNTNMNRNPKIAHNVTGGLGGIISNAMIVWEVYENSRWNIYGATYSNSAWSAPYPVDTSAGDKHNPYISFNPASTTNMLYGIVYEKNNDIFFKNFDSNLKQTLNEYNLTSAETEICRNPRVLCPNYMSSVYHFVTYEKQKSNGSYGVYYKKANYSWAWSGDTICTIGNNKNSGIASSVNYITITYESDRSGKWGLYSSDYYNSVSASMTLIQSPYWNYRNVVNFVFPVITDYWGFVNSCIKQTVSSTKIMSSTGQLGNFPDSIAVGDSSSKTVITMGNGILNTSNWMYRVWMVYDKDSANQSSLYARGTLVWLAGLKKISNEIPDEFSLNQNYPNPFNPVTKITFKIPSSEGYGVSRVVGLVSLRIFDITGREVQTLINEELKPGTYEVTFDGNGLNSGVYFYKLTAGDFTETKRMILVK